MGKHAWRTHGLALIAVGGLLATLAWAETTEIVTYYPIPNTAINDLGRLNVRRILTVGTDEPVATPPTPYGLTNPADNEDYRGTLFVAKQVRLGENISGTLPFDGEAAIHVVQPETPGESEPIVLQSGYPLLDGSYPSVDLRVGKTNVGGGIIQSRSFLRFGTRFDPDGDRSFVSMGMSIPATADSISRDLIFATAAGSAFGTWRERMRIVNDDTNGYVKISDSLVLNPTTILPAPADAQEGMVRFLHNDVEPIKTGLYYFANGEWLQSFGVKNDRIGRVVLASDFTIPNNIIQQVPGMVIPDRIVRRGLYIVKWDAVIAVDANNDRVLIDPGGPGPDDDDYDYRGVYAVCRLDFSVSAPNYYLVAAAIDEDAVDRRLHDKIVNPPATDPRLDGTFTEHTFSGSTFMVLTGGNRPYNFQFRVRKTGTAGGNTSKILGNRTVNGVPVEGASLELDLLFPL